MIKLARRQMIQTIFLLMIMKWGRVIGRRSRIEQFSPKIPMMKIQTKYVRRKVLKKVRVSSVTLTRVDIKFSIVIFIGSQIVTVPPCPDHLLPKTFLSSSGNLAVRTVPKFYSLPSSSKFPTSMYYLVFTLYILCIFDI